MILSLLQSEREKQILYINAYMWNLRKLMQMILFAKQKQRHRCREKNMDTKGGNGMDWMNWEFGIDIYTLLILCIK